jgi:MFS family permease
MWILPGLVGPPIGAALASTIGWRWAFLAPLPVLLAGWLLIAPALDLVPHEEERRARAPIRWAAQLMVGAGLAFTSLTIVRPWALAMLAAGLVTGVPALRRIVPPGTFRAAPGVPAAALAAFLLSFGFLAVDAFLTLMLTEVRGQTLAEASIAVTAATVSWALGSMWQSGRAERTPLRRLIVIGTIPVMAGSAAVASALSPDVPLLAAYAGWALVGAGMGIVFPTIPLATMRQAGAGEESSELSSVLLMDMLGVATGAGLGGGAVALAEALDAPITAGIGGSFAMGFLALLGLLAVARRVEATAPAR